MRQNLEYLAVLLLVRTLGALPWPFARFVGRVIAYSAYVLHGRLRRVGTKNLKMALPELTEAERKRILRAVFAGLGRQLAEFSQFPKYTRDNVSKVAVYEGFENFDSARRLGKGVLFLTAHVGAWEIGSFAHS